jgi:hypothetical protein
VLWGTDGIRIETVEGGWVGVSMEVDHCDGCCVGHHMVKTESRFVALVPIALGLHAYLRRTAAEAA